MAQWTASWEALIYGVGDVVNVMDNDYLQLDSDYSGRLRRNGTTTLAFLDRPITLESGKNYQIGFMHSDGSLVERAVTTAPGTGITEINCVALPHNAWEFRQWYVYADVAPRPFIIHTIKETEFGTFQVEAVQYDPTKYRQSRSQRTI